MLMQFAMLGTEKMKIGEQHWGFSQKAGQTVDVSSAAPHYKLLTLNSFSTPPTFHIFLVIRQQSMLLCVAWAHCFSSLTDFYTFFSNSKVFTVSAFQNKHGTQFSFTSRGAQEEQSSRGWSAQTLHTFSSCEHYYNSFFMKVQLDWPYLLPREYVICRDGRDTEK